MSTRIDPLIRAAYSPAEVGEILGVTRTHVANMVRTGQIPARKLGQRILIPRWWVDQFLSEPADD